MHLVLVDGSGFIFRAFHALPPMTRPDGTPVNAVFGFTNMLARLMKDHTGSHLAVIFDAGRTTFRNRIYDQYKAHRPEPPDELRPQFALVREATLAFGVPSIELPDWEADDLIAAYTLAATNAGGQVTIVSSDKDLMQLIRPGVQMQDPIKQKLIGPEEVREKFGCGPEKMTDLLALMGDSVDNVPGVPGIGPKTACQLLAEFGDLEGVLAAAPAMKPSKRRELLITHAEQARLSRSLVVLHDEAPLPEPLDQLVLRDPDRGVLSTWLHAQGFRSTALRLGLEGPAQDDTQAAQPAPPPPAGFGPYECVTNAEALLAWLAPVPGSGKLAVHAAMEGKRLAGIGLATAPGRAVYVPLAHQGDLERQVQQVDVGDLRAALDPLLADPAVLTIFHDAKTDLLALRRGRLRARGCRGRRRDDDLLRAGGRRACARAWATSSHLHLGHTAEDAGRRHRHRAHPAGLHPAAAGTRGAAGGGGGGLRAAPVAHRCDPRLPAGAGHGAV